MFVFINIYFLLFAILLYVRKVFLQKLNFEYHFKFVFGMIFLYFVNFTVLFWTEEYFSFPINKKSVSDNFRKKNRNWQLTFILLKLIHTLKHVCIFCSNRISDIKGWCFHNKKMKWFSRWFYWKAFKVVY